VTRYRHTQFGSAVVYGLLIVAGGTAGLSYWLTAARVAWVPAVIVILTIPFFWKLTVEINDQDLLAVFGLGMVRKKVRLADIAECEPIRIQWWYGWGIHMTPYGWLYNVSGWDAVAITLRNGRRLSIGTDQPGELADAIRSFASAR
jgi:hypothetical protein